MERYLFLDIDGVLNTMRYSDYLTEHDKDDTDEDGALFDPEAVANLETIIKNVPDVKIIISSTWRFKGLDESTMGETATSRKDIQLHTWIGICTIQKYSPSDI